MDLISVAIGAPTDEARYSDNLELLEYGFSQYKRRLPIHAGQDLADPEIRYSGGALPLRAARSVEVGLRRGQQLEVEVDAPAEVEGPIKRGAKLGARPSSSTAAAPPGAAAGRARDPGGQRLRPRSRLRRRPPDPARDPRAS